jgi:hypothetical protein
MCHLKPALSRGAKTSATEHGDDGGGGGLRRWCSAPSSRIASTRPSWKTISISLCSMRCRLASRLGYRIDVGSIVDVERQLTPFVAKRFSGVGASRAHGQPIRFATFSTRWSIDTAASWEMPYLSMRDDDALTARQVNNIAAPT